MGACGGARGGVGTCDRQWEWVVVGGAPGWGRGGVGWATVKASVGLGGRGYSAWLDGTV